MRSTEPDSVVHVVAGLVFDRGRRVLIARRPDQSHQGGKWEFPGGKLDAGERAFDALKRELHEELGIEIQSAQPYVQVTHTYPDRTVLLDTWQVTAYRGEPHGREGQPLRWVPPNDLRVADFPAADRPILRRLQLPALYLITDFRRYGTAVLMDKLARALRAGARLVQLREPGMPEVVYEALARDVLAMCRDHGAKLLLNTTPELAGAYGADGVHLNSSRLMRTASRPMDDDHWVAASCHNEAELAQAERLGLDFVVLAPVRPTASHPHAAPMGWAAFRRSCGCTGLPIFALGGMQVEDITPARAASAQGVAMISGMWDRDDIETAVAAAQ